MSTNPILHYYRELEKVKRAGHTRNETTLRAPFQRLLQEYCQTRELQFLTEISLKTSLGTIIRPDGVVRDTLGILDWGYWESKDPNDDLEDEIQRKLANGYPRFNILFEDSQTAILIQDENKYKANISDPVALDEILKAFIHYERPEIQEFRAALEVFRAEVPDLTQRLRELLLLQKMGNPDFQKASTRFLEICRQAINPAVAPDDVNEMLVQHILTEDLFVSIFDNPDFHRENAIARELENVLATFFTGKDKKNFLRSIRHYYETIKARVSDIPSLSEKQRILKVVYEEFYKAYNPKGADRLGIVYTPNEIVRFMVRSVDQLLDKHFNKTLSDEGVNILDPATGTGTYICDLIEYIIPQKRKFKYQNEIFCNEVSILPYYIANLNIEFTYSQLAGEYEPFENLCFVDTLDNIDGLSTYEGQTQAGGLFRGLTEENAERIKRQNEQKISVIIGNPPYNANQQNENDNNKNRDYPEIDKRIKETFVKESSAQKTKVYDMYARFYRWAMDRLTDKGVIAFVTNRSFIDSRTFDGFRKCIETDFSEAYIVDTRSDVRANPKIAGTTHNVFGIQTGVAVMFLVRKPKPADNPQPCKIFYVTLQDEQRKEQKLDWFAHQRDFDQIDFTRIRPDKNHNWINLQTDEIQAEWEALIPVADKGVKSGKGGNAIFEIYANGVVTARDEWVYALQADQLQPKIEFLLSVYRKQVESGKFDANDLDYRIKWSESLKAHLKRGKIIIFDIEKIHHDIYRPFIALWYYFDTNLSDRLTSLHKLFFGEKGQIDANRVIMFSGTSSSKPFQTLATNSIWSVDTLEKTQGLALYRYTPTGERIDNITDWALERFRTRYGGGGDHTSEVFKTSEVSITKRDIFHYVYAVLHDPAYREKYRLNLKRDFPRIPFYDDFWQWAAWGKQLMDLHVGFETVEPWPLERREKPVGDHTSEVFKTSEVSKPTTVKLRADKEAGLILIDDQTTLAGVPPQAWDYQLGNRSALDWILDQYKETKIKDPTIAQKTAEGVFKAYRFADHKETVIDLLCRVCRVSVETMRIVGEMK